MSDSLQCLDTFTIFTAVWVDLAAPRTCCLRIFGKALKTQVQIGKPGLTSLDLSRIRPFQGSRTCESKERKTQKKYGLAFSRNYVIVPFLCSLWTSYDPSCLWFCAKLCPVVSGTLAISFAFIGYVSLCCHYHHTCCVLCTNVNSWIFWGHTTYSRKVLAFVHVQRSKSHWLQDLHIFQNLSCNFHATVDGACQKASVTTSWRMACGQCLPRFITVLHLPSTKKL